MRVFYTILAVVYGAWFWWYGGRGEPISQPEVARYLSTLAGDARPWDAVAIVRYRSVRDMFEMVTEPGMIELSSHKWASIEETHVFPVKAAVSLIMVRLIAAVLLVALALIATGLRRLLYR